MLREEVHADYDSFDMGYYAYGLSLYGNMPLIEPLETRETYKIRDFVIVLDTSYSVSGELVEHFLQETFTILTESDSFFVRNKIPQLYCGYIRRSRRKKRRADSGICRYFRDYG